MSELLNTPNYTKACGFRTTVFRIVYDEAEEPKCLTMSETPKLEVRNLNKSFFVRGRDLEVLSEINLAVRPGEFVSLVGASGCGKTTLLKIIDGLIPPSTGEIFLDGRSISKPGLDRGFVFQMDGLFPWRRVVDNVSFGLELQGVNKKETERRAIECIELVGLTGFEKYYPAELSGGMRQRVNLARALVVDPQVLLMDEPFASLDAQTREIMQGELLRIWRTKTKTVLFVTHQIDEAVYLSDRVFVLTTRPGRLRDQIKIDIPRPRTLETKRTTQFVAYVDRIWKLIEEEVRSGMLEIHRIKRR